MDKKALYFEYINCLPLPYFQYLQDTIKAKIESEKNRLCEINRSWEDTLIVKGRIDGLKIALALMDIDKPEGV